MRKLLWGGGIVLGLAVVAYLVLIFGCGSMVRSQINADGPRLTQTSVALTAAQLSPFSGTGTLFGLTVGNPKGWSQPDAFELKSIHIVVVPSSLFSDHIVIDEIDIEDPELVYESHLLSSNIGDLIKNIKKATSHPADKPSSGKKTTFVIKKLRLEQGHVTLGVGPTAMTIDLAPIEFNNLGSGAGVTSEQLSLLVMRTIATDVVKGTAGAIGHGVVGVGTLAGDVVKGSLDVLGSMVGSL